MAAYAAIDRAVRNAKILTNYYGNESVTFPLEKSLPVYISYDSNDDAGPGPGCVARYDLNGDVLRLKWQIDSIPGADHTLKSDSFGYNILWGNRVAKITGDSRQAVSDLHSTSMFARYYFGSEIEMNLLLHGVWTRSGPWVNWDAEIKSLPISNMEKAFALPTNSRLRQLATMRLRSYKAVMTSIQRFHPNIGGSDSIAFHVGVGNRAYAFLHGGKVWLAGYKVSGARAKEIFFVQLGSNRAAFGQAGKRNYGFGPLGIHVMDNGGLVSAPSALVISEFKRKETLTQYLVNRDWCAMEYIDKNGMQWASDEYRVIDKVGLPPSFQEADLLRKRRTY